MAAASFQKSDVRDDRMQAFTRELGRSAEEHLRSGHYWEARVQVSVLQRTLVTQPWSFNLSPETASLPL